MCKDVEERLKDGDNRISVNDRFPRIVIVIILAEFCERFSFSGMRAFLTLYLRSKLGYSDEGATETYHIFSTFVYVFPIIGGILADNYLGKFRTILYMMFVYAAGNLLVSLTAIPQLAFPGRLCTLIGLFLITVGTGGIKPCVTAFGGDQFILPQQEKHLAIYFSILYFTLCTGSLIAKTVSPILRAEVYCFGDKDCYSLAFGAPGLVVLMSIVIFVSAKNRYVMKQPEGNVLIDFIKCVSLGIKNALLRHGRNERYSHWLDTTQHRYDKRFIKDIKKTLSLLMLFTVLPVFWSLLDQIGSRWTIQATKMDGRFGFVTIKPDQMQVIGPICILIMIPLSQKYIYPFLEQRNVLKNPLHKLMLGGVLAGIALIASGVLEIYLKTTYPILPKPGYSQMRIFNGNPCSVSIENNELNIAYTIPSLSHAMRNIPSSQPNITLKIAGACIEERDELFTLEDNRAISFFLTDEVVRFVDKVDKSKSGFPVVRFLTLNPNPLILYNELRSEIEAEITTGVSNQLEVFTSTYTLLVGNKTISSGIELESGGVYTIIVDNNGTVIMFYNKVPKNITDLSDSKFKHHVKQVSNIVVITQANSITMALLFPQFIIMSAGEVLFAITGNEFAFKESPESMKAVMTSVWLLTEAMGNIIIIIVTRLFVDYQQETQSFMYSGLMFLSLLIFYYISRGYEFGFGDEETTRKEFRRESEVLYLRVKQAEEVLDH